MSKAAIVTSLLAACFLGAVPSAQLPRIPISFEPNRGQTAAGVEWLARGMGYGLFIDSRGATVALTRANGNSVRTSALRLDWVGGRKIAAVAEGPVQRKSNYIDKEQQIAAVPHFQRIRYREVYTGVDLLYYGNEGELEYDLVLRPGADPERVRFRLTGGDEPKLVNGDLVVSTPSGDIRHRKPIAYQVVGQEKRSVSAAYRKLRHGEVGFALGEYDRSLPLIIDPIISYARALGGSQSDVAGAVAVDAGGNAYVTGTIESSYNFPITSGTYNTSAGSRYATFVMKLNPAGEVVYSTYLGGNGFGTGRSIAVDSTGSAFVVGATSSADMPVTLPGSRHSGHTDAYAFRLSPDGTALQFAAYLGGTQADEAVAIAIAPDRRAFIVGNTYSTDFMQVNRTTQDQDLFIVTVNAASTTATFSGYRGGNGQDVAWAAALASNGNLLVAGNTFSANLQGTSLQPAHAGGYDGFVAAYGGANLSQVFWAYIGGSSEDIVTDIATDTDGNLYVVGATDSADFPLPMPMMARKGGREAFLLRLNAGATARTFGTFLGGTSDDLASTVSVNAQKHVYVAGWTASDDFPRVDSLTGRAQDLTTDGFVTKFNLTGPSIIYSTYLGGNAYDFIRDSAALGEHVFVVGETSSDDAPGLVGVTSTDGFIYKLGEVCGAHTVTPGQANLGAQGGTVQFQVTTRAGCYWTATSETSLAAVTGGASGFGNGIVTLEVQPNPSTRTRILNATVAGNGISIQQFGSGATTPPACSVQAGSTSVLVPTQGSAGELIITAANNCSWVATSNAPWLIVSPVYGTGSLPLIYTVAPNFRPATRFTTLVVNDKVVTFNQSASPLNPDQRFVQLLYFSFLGRTPTQAELDHWVTEINRNGQKRYADVALGFLNSPEFAMGGRFVAGLYVGLLDRTAEFRGWLYQRDALARGWVGNPESLARNFMESTEYQQRFGTLSPSQFVRRLYQTVLLREPSDEEVAGWVRQMVPVGQASRAFIAVQFLRSSEFTTKVGPRLTAFLLYAALLQRDPSQAELDLRMGQLTNISQDGLRNLIADFLNTPEFKQVVGW